MKKCAIEDCINNDKDQAKNKGVTYHMFPKDPELCDAWIESLRIPKFLAYYRRMVCSKHFKEDDFYVSKGKRKLKLGAVPRLEDCHGPAALRTCKICLAIDAKMYKLNNGLDKMYQDVMGIEPRADHLNRLPMAICWECTARLNSAASFKSKALYCDELLHDHLLTNADLKVLHIQKIHEGQSHLKSSIAVQQVFKFNSHDDEDHAPNTFIKAEIIGIPNNEETEVDLQSLVTDKMTVKNERNSSILSNFPANDYKTEVDLVPPPISLVEIGDDKNFVEYYDDGEFETITENIYIGNENSYLDSGTENNNLDSGNENTNQDSGHDNTNLDPGNENTNVDPGHENTNLGSANVSTNQEEIETDNNNDAMDITQIMETNDEELMEMAMNLTSSDEEKSGDSDDEAIPIQLKDKTVLCVKKRKKRKKDDDVVVWVKGRRQKKKSPYVKPSIPIDEDIFSMHPLDPDDLRKEILARKDSTRYMKSPFKCKICYKGFPTKEAKENHMIKHSEKCGPIKCNICLVRMRRTRDLRAHFSRQHTTQFICKLCPLKTRNRNVAQGHMRYHNGSKYKCPQCSIEFEKKTTLLNHLRLKHMSGFVCELCGYTFVSTAGVEVHKRLKHKIFDPNDAEFTGPYCEECGVKFLTDKAYNRHLRLSSKHIAEDDPNRMSNDPSIKERRLGNINTRRVRRPVIHSKTENEPSNRPIICEQCGIELENMRMYSLHFRQAHPGINRTQFTSGVTPYMCEHCGKFFNNSTTLSCHMWVHTGQKLFQCDHCSKTFTIKSNLVGHMRVHDGTRRYFTCNICGKQFTFSYNLTRHMFLHTGLKPFKCDACEKTFRTASELRTHVDHVHLKKPRPKRVRRKTNKCEVQTLEY